MATRFYLPASGTCPITPTPDTAWDTTTGFGSYPTDTTKTNTALANGTTRTSTVVLVLENRLDRVYVSTQQLAGQTITAGTFSGVVLCEESSGGADAWWQVIIRVVSSDGSVVRGTLYAGSTATSPSATTGAENGEMGAASFQSRIKNALPTTSVTALSGDRIQIELGARWIPSSTSRTFFIGYGDPTGTADAALTAALSTNRDPWVELSNTLTFGGVTSWSDAPTAAGVGAAAVSGLVTVRGAVLAAGVGAATVLALQGFFGAAVAAGQGAATVGGFGFGVRAAGVGAATVTGLATKSGAPAAAGTGTASVSGRDTIPGGPVAAGVGGGTVTAVGGAIAISFVGAAAAQTPNETAPSTTSIDSALPAGIVADDLILIAVDRQQDYALTGTPTGYTALDNVIDLGSTSPAAAQTDIFYRFADGSETTTGPTFATASPSRFITDAAVYRGVDKTAPFIAHAGQATSSGTASRTAPAISNTNVKAWGVFCTTMRQAPTPLSFTAPSGMTERLDSDIGVTNTGTSSSNMAAEWADTNGQVGSTGSITYTATSSDTSPLAVAWAAFLKPTAGGVVWTGGVTAAGAGAATVAGFDTGVDAPEADGIGAATVTGPVVVVISSVGAGAAGVAVTDSLVTEVAAATAAGIGAASVTDVHSQLGAVTAAGAGTAAAAGIPIHLPDAVLAAAGVGAAAVHAVMLLVSPPHIAVDATIMFDGISDATVLAVPPGDAVLDDLGQAPDADVTWDGISDATVLPVAPGEATVETS